MDVVQKLESALTPDTSVVSVMSVNNEIGVKQPIAEIGALCRQNKSFFHTDAAQAVGKVTPVIQTLTCQSKDILSIKPQLINQMITC